MIRKQEFDMDISLTIHALEVERIGYLKQFGIGVFILVLLNLVVYYIMKETKLNMFLVLGFIFNLLILGFSYQYQNHKFRHSVNTKYLYESISLKDATYKPSSKTFFTKEYIDAKHLFPKKVETIDHTFEMHSKNAHIAQVKLDSMYEDEDGVPRYEAFFNGHLLHVRLKHTYDVVVLRPKNARHENLFTPEDDPLKGLTKVNITSDIFDIYSKTPLDILPDLAEVETFVKQYARPTWVVFEKNQGLIAIDSLKSTMDIQLYRSLREDENLLFYIDAIAFMQRLSLE